MGPDSWGPYVWASIHLIAIGAPEAIGDRKQEFRDFVEILPSVIPCAVCRTHFAENLQKYPLKDEHLVSNETFFKWTVDIHNIVNQQLGKPVIEYESAKAQWSSICNKKTADYTLWWVSCIVLLVVIAVVFYINA